MCVTHATNVPKLQLVFIGVTRFLKSNIMGQCYKRLGLQTNKMDYVKVHSIKPSQFLEYLA